MNVWFAQNAHRIAGLDEAGRGPLAGAVVAAAVVLDPQKPISGLNDSKKLSSVKRDELYSTIIDNALCFGIAEIAPQQIDSMNILRASLQAMADAFAIADMSSPVPLIGALIDGNQRAPLSATIIQHTVIGGDAIWPSIMAASILAKVTRDRIMLKAAQEFPVYGFERNKGYGTAEHLAALQKFGPCPLHRRSFAPVRTQELGL